jgi:hypothetical protein
MKNSIDTKDAAASPAPASQVQTSAQPAAEVQHKHPSTGGSFTRNVATGELASNKPAPADQPEQE